MGGIKFEAKVCFEYELQEGMTVITTGNVNLAHETPVKIINK